MKPIELFSREELDLLHLRTIEILEKIGIRVGDESAKDLLTQSGAERDEKRKTIRIPESLVKEALKTAPREITLYGRNPEFDMRLVGGRVHFGLGMNAEYVLDLETGERRRSTKDDVGRIARLADALQNIAFVMPLASALDMPEDIQDLHEFEALLNNTEKPVVCWAEHGRLLIKMAAAVAGGIKELRVRPILCNCALTVSPLQHHAKYLETLIESSKAGVPIIYGSCIQMGATGPATIAGSLAQANAEILSALVISQLAAEGSPFIYACEGSILDQKAMVMAYGAPELSLFDLGATALAGYYGLPNFGTGGCTDSKVVDGQAVGEATQTALLAALGGANLIHGIGYMESSATASFEMVVVGDEMAGAVRQILADTEISPETLAFETIQETGPGGSFLSSPHTLKHYRKHHRTTLMDRRGFAAWQRDSAKELQVRAKEKALALLRAHQVEPVPGDISSRIREILRGDVSNY